MTSPSKKTGTGRAARRRVYSFGPWGADGDRSLRNVLGGKGANLAEMCRLGLPVPPGFTISTQVCAEFAARGGRRPAGLEREVARELAKIEKEIGKGFGDPENPLLVSVRSGARVSMPGMMDTILNLGLCDATVEGLARRSQNPRFAWDAYRRFVQMYADVVLGLKAERETGADPFDEVFDKHKRARGVRLDTELDAEALRAVVAEFKAIVSERSEIPFPEEPMEQLWGAVRAVFRSWGNERAVAYRAMNRIPDDWGTAVNVVAMVFGNLGATSGTGVAFTRDPATGEKRFYGEVLMNAQGEDVVAGTRTPLPVETLAKESPKAWRELLRVQKLLERHFRDMQDLEFTIEEGRLWMLQCRTGKRTGPAAVRIAVDMVRERLIRREEALQRVEPESLDQLLQPVFKPAEIAKARKNGNLLTVGLNAGPGAASGRLAFGANAAREAAAGGGSVILVRSETSPEDILGMQASSGILTARGGMTSHAALVGRQMGKVCVVGAGDLEIDAVARTMRVGGKRFGPEDWISLDGTTGEVFSGRISTQPSLVVEHLFDGRRSRGRDAAPSARDAAPPERNAAPIVRAFQELMRWADETRTLRVRANADQPDQCRNAVAFGAEGVGLCRTEHMFFGEGRIDLVRAMILAESLEDREKALAKLLPLQRADFDGIFRAMAGHPVTVRTLDPPLHEFLPHDDGTITKLAREMGVSEKTLRAHVEALKEQNPMLGHRGCRLGISHPEITRMQARAIFEAACDVAGATRHAPDVEIMIPLVATKRELDLQEGIVRSVAAEVFAEKKRKIPYLVGTMIELPRSALTAGDIARTAEFFSFGTNDLTQTTYGISRDDGGKFLPVYLQQKIFADDPFATLDREGVGRLMQIACTEGRKSRPKLKLGICGEHGGDPRSIAFCHELGLEYVSCSPFRIPLARLAAAQAALRGRSAGRAK